MFETGTTLFGLDANALVTAVRTVVAVALTSFAKFLRPIDAAETDGGDSVIENVAVFGDEDSEMDEFDLDSLRDSVERPGSECDLTSSKMS